MPFPVARTADGLLMQYIGDPTRWPSRPAWCTPGWTVKRVQLAATQLIANLERMATEGVVHADLSVYNLLWWDDVLWIIDVPQAVDITTEPAGARLPAPRPGERRGSGSRREASTSTPSSASASSSHRRSDAAPVTGIIGVATRNRRLRVDIAAAGLVVLEGGRHLAHGDAAADHRTDAPGADQLEQLGVHLAADRRRERVHPEPAGTRSARPCRRGSRRATEKLPIDTRRSGRR